MDLTQLTTRELWEHFHPQFRANQNKLLATSIVSEIGIPGAMLFNLFKTPNPFAKVGTTQAKSELHQIIYTCIEQVGRASFNQVRVVSRNSFSEDTIVAFWRPADYRKLSRLLTKNSVKHELKETRATGFYIHINDVYSALPNSNKHTPNGETNV